MLAFDEATHSYTWCGKPVPGVTKILKPLVDFSGVPPAVLAVKAELGTMVHAATELDDAGTLDESTVPDAVQGYLQAWRAFKSVYEPVVIHNEQPVYHQALGYAGTLDRVVFMAGDEWLLDIKTSAEVPLSAGPQTAAYAHALGQPDLKRGVVLLRADGSFVIAPLTNAGDWLAFQACLAIHRFKESHRV